VDVARAETIDAELDRLISRRASQDRRPHPDEQDERWKMSVAAYNAARIEENRQAWCEYHQLQAERHRAVLEKLIASHQAEAERLASWWSSRALMSSGWAAPRLRSTRSAAASR
jgi:predicted deacetylase